jgi:hypothetical protein
MTQKVIKQRERREDMQTRRPSKLVLRLVAILAFAGALAILGCPDDSDEFAMRNVDARVDLTNSVRTGALTNRTFVFPRGVAAFGLNTETEVLFFAATGVRITDTNETDETDDDIAAETGVAYAIENGEGRCTFTILSSDFPAGHPLAFGADPIIVVPCFYEVEAINVDVGGAAAPGTLVLVLNRTRSQIFGDDADETPAVQVQLDEDGNLFVNGVRTGIIITGSGGEGT